ncbi:uncharacterized protein PHACADRAFT_82233, partial [Phanerochaete carnosa HHB-10118-sp]
VATAKVNQTTKKKSIRVYGLLTDFHYFRFFSYDPVQGRFYFDEEITAAGKRE